MKSIYLVLFSTWIISCSAPINKEEQEFTQGEKAVVLLLSKKITQKLKVWKPSSEDLEIVKEVLANAVIDGEFDFLKEPKLESIFNYYYRQYIPFIDEDGDRMIEVNAFCDSIYKEELKRNPDREPLNWKEHYVMFLDGGSCFWNIIINIDKKTYANMQVNGQA
ncbi:hypothetical protein SAMN05216480_11388 [Pustulibacterium marinum]|uniref:Lipoprotein n=1 Tax=Pustulibacterium marinum TaxID=1224947 RepID=A0A1I7I7K5_9FLAO|nr:hypothetical protein [Pustulibacterium marinum]SFU68953.1 hypothetical protein SAMN05216480_11388 [Pustulibacterium marinum]